MMQLAMKKNKTDVNENDISDKLRLHGIYNSIINNLDINLQDVNNSLEHIKSTWHALKSSMDAINVLNKNTGKNKLYQLFYFKESNQDYVTPSEVTRLVTKIKDNPTHRLK